MTSHLRWTHLVAVLALLAGGLLVFAFPRCGHDVDPAAVPAHRVFAIAEAGAEHIDPNLATESVGTRVARQLFEGLVAIEPGNPLPVPAGAVSWETSADGKTWTFSLRKEARWSDGTPVTSADYMYSAERVLHPSTQSRNAMQLWIVEGAKAYNTGETTDFGTVGVDAPDAHTIRYRLVGPAPYFLHLLTYVAYSPVPRQAIEPHGKQWTRPQNIVVNGAFTLTRWKLREVLRMERNESYWGAAEVWLDAIELLETENENMGHDWYERGKVHWTPGIVPVEKTRGLLRAGRADYHIDPVLCTYFYTFNTRAPPFDDVRVRRAFNMAFDKGLLVRDVLGQGQNPATHLVPPHFSQSLGFTSPEGDPFDPARARELLADAGYGPGGKDFPPVTIIYNTYEAHRMMAEFFQRSVQTHLGVEVAINNMEWKTLLQTLHAGEFQLGRSSWCADYPDPENFLTVLHSEGENNYGNYQSAEYDALLSRLQRAETQQARNQLAHEAESMLNRDVPLMNFYHYTRGYMLRGFVRGFEQELQDIHYLKYIWFGEPGTEKPAP